MQAAKMFTKNSAFVKMSTRRPHRRKSEIHRSVHAVYKSPPHIFSERNKLLNESFTRLYWTLRELQFRLFFRNEDMETNSMEELARIEPPEKPPTLEQLDELTGGRFSQRWLKYMYNRFKNECPNGRMRFGEFKRLFGTFVPDRMNDGYLERMFSAFCQNSLQSDQLTFRDLVICLSRLCDENPASNADWTMRLIGRDRSGEGQISYQEFLDYVKSVFNLRGKNEQIEQQKKRAGSMALGAGGSPPPSAGPFPIEKEQSQQKAASPISSPRPPPIVRSAALLASAITTPTAAPAIANFVPFVGNPKRGSASPDQEALRAICQRAAFLFKELDSDQKGYLTSGDFERFFRTREQQRALVYASC